MIHRGIKIVKYSILIFFVLIISYNWIISSEELSLLIQQIDSMINEKNALYEVEISVVRGEVVNKYELIMWYKNKNFVAVVKQPESEKGIVYLMYGGNAWIYYPTIQKKIKITPKQKILGSDFSFYELSGIDLVKDYTYYEISVDDVIADKKVSEFISEEILHKMPKVIQCNIKNLKKLQNFPRVFLLIDKDNNLLSIFLYNNAMNLHSVLEYKDYKELSGRFRPTAVILRNVIHKTYYTKIIYKFANYEVKIPDIYFSATNMENLSGLYSKFLRE